MAGWIAFAGMLLIVIGGIDVFQGLIACSRTSTTSPPRPASWSST
jgi:hypothetical protein